jgi:hypothetical protein
MKVAVELVDFEIQDKASKLTFAWKVTSWFPRKFSKSTSFRYQSVAVSSYSLRAIFQRILVKRFFYCYAYQSMIIARSLRKFHEAFKLFLSMRNGKVIRLRTSKFTASFATGWWNNFSNVSPHFCFSLCLKLNFSDEASKSLGEKRKSF